uniref:Uncharacterized protein n=1 Tax=Salix viminalis TaxID=40686 RepID=A0A6N2LRW4_SALVM
MHKFRKSVLELGESSGHARDAVETTHLLDSLWELLKTTPKSKLAQLKTVQNKCRGLKKRQESYEKSVTKPSLDDARKFRKVFWSLEKVVGTPETLLENKLIFWIVSPTW